MVTMQDIRHACIFIIYILLLIAGHAYGGSFKIQMGGNMVDDARITSISPDFNGGNDGWGNVTYFSSNGNAERYYIRISIPGILDSIDCDSISQVNLKIYFNAVQTPGFRICSQEVVETWNERSITWNNKPQNDTSILDTLTLERDTMWATFSITGVFKNWLCGERANYGILLRALWEGQGEQNLSVCWSSDYLEHTLRPILEIFSSELPDTLITDYPTSVNSNKVFPKGFDISQNFPNPFNPSTTIRYDVPKATHVLLTVYDVLGRDVAKLVNGPEEPGYKSVQWDASGVSSGIYFSRLQAGDFVQTKKILLLR